MDDVEVNIRNAAEQLFLLKGPSGTNMTQVATAAGVSRQTVYAYFDNKDVLIASVAKQIMTKLRDQLEIEWASCASLSAVLDAFCRIFVFEPFAIIQRHPDLKSLLQDGSERTMATVKGSEAEILKRLTAQLEPYSTSLVIADISAEQVADYIARVAKGLKYGSSTQQELEVSLNILTKSILALTGQNTG